ncbi:hypothetical protein HMPREF9555_02216 [Selenomonas artemidis F0399]|uniref:Uncharacterized protein n=1 Tax=Selenomonas artemidis F0399 TaxID=749551 RepID=E7N5C1_9FIRM|nr:hypothetical protein HMPREF9555_02216 [Selenomonas artemidis F0399]
MVRKHILVAAQTACDTNDMRIAQVLCTAQGIFLAALQTARAI